MTRVTLEEMAQMTLTDDWGGVRDDVRRAVWAVMYGIVWSPVRRAVGAVVLDDVRRAVWDVVWRAVHGIVYGAVNGAVSGVVWDVMRGVR
jgi:hypothetical protein